MQTFLPYPSIAQSVHVLDDKRLGKQRVECKQILIALLAGRGWIHHPATKMWKGYEDALGMYMNYCIDEWERRGFKNNMQRYVCNVPVEWPDWIGDTDLHRSHRQNLVRKYPEHYSQFMDDDPDDWYVWIVDGVKYKKKVNSKLVEYYEQYNQSVA